MDEVPPVKASRDIQPQAKNFHRLLVKKKESRNNETNNKKSFVRLSAERAVRPENLPFYTVLLYNVIKKIKKLKREREKEEKNSFLTFRGFWLFFSLRNVGKHLRFDSLARQSSQRKLYHMFTTTYKACTAHLFLDVRRFGQQLWAQAAKRLRHRDWFVRAIDGDKMSLFPLASTLVCNPAPSPRVTNNSHVYRKKIKKKIYNTQAEMFIWHNLVTKELHFSRVKLWWVGFEWEWKWKSAFIMA